MSSIVRPGVIGLTPAGQTIDAILAKENPPYRMRLIKFITKFTTKSRALRQSIDGCADKQLILNLLKEHYYRRLDKELKPLITTSLYTNTQSYINALTRIDFVPNTKTQQSLMRRARLPPVRGVSV